MPDYQTIVDEIRGILLSPDATRTDRDEVLAREYALVCVEVNTRLTGCQRLIKQGLRAEAVHQAKSTPDLIEAVETLFAFPSRVDWIERIQLYGLTVPQELDAEPFASLQEAFADEAPLDDLLRRHRRLALARAPLRERIGVLRKLATQDPATAIWSEDVAIYETARIDQLRSDIERAKQSRDVRVLEELETELTATGWTITVPPQVVAEVRRSLGRFRREDARAELERVEATLNDCHAAFDVPAGRSARVRWLELLDQAGLSPDDPLRERAEPALHWLSECDRREEADAGHRRAVALLESELDNNAPRSDLERAYQAVVRFELGLPPVLETRYSARIRSHEIELTRKRRLVLISSVTGIVVVGAVGAWQFHSMGRARQARLVGNVIVRALSEGNLEEARKAEEAVRKDDPDLLNRAEAAEALSRLTSAEKTEEQRLRDFEAALAEAESAPVSKQSPEPLERARKLARRHEVAKVDRLEARRRREYESLVTKNTAALLPNAQAVLAQVTKLRESIMRSDDFEPIAAQLQGLLAKRPKLDQDRDLYADELLSADRVILQLAEEITTEIGIRRREQSFAQALARGVQEVMGRPEAYPERLASCLQDPSVANRLQAKDYDRALREKEAWSAALDWSRHAMAWSVKPLDVPASEANDRVKICDKFLYDHPAFADKAVVESLRDYFKSIRSRVEARSRLETVLSSFLFDKIYRVEDDEGDTPKFYYSKSPFNSRQPVTVYFSGFTLESIARKRFIPERTRCELSPQSKQVDALRGALRDDPQFAKWDSIMLDSISRLAADPKLDPIPKRLLMVQVMRAASQGDTCLRDAIADSLKRLEDSTIPEGLRWMVPESDVECNPVRVEIRRIVGKLTPRDEILSRLKESRAELARSVQLAPRPIGVLARTKGTHWVCAPTNSSPGDGTLFVIVPGSGQSSVWKKVGSVTARKAAIEPGETGLLVQGRLVFLVPEEKPSRATGS